MTRPEVGGDVTLKRNDLRVFIREQSAQALIRVNTSPPPIIDFSPILKSIGFYGCAFSNFKGDPTSLEIRNIRFRQVGKKFYIEPNPEKAAARRKR